MIPLLVNPSLLVIMGLTVGLLWIAIRQHRPHLALIAAGFMLFSVGVAAQILRYPAELRLNAVVSAVFYSTGASAFALGVVRRSSAKGGGPALLGLTALIIAGIALVIFAAVSVFGEQLSSMWEDLGSQLNG